MKRYMKVFKIAGLILGAAAATVQAGVGLNWSTPSGLMRADGTTPLLGSGAALFQVIRSLDGIADPPTVDGGVSGDDVLLAQQVADASTASSHGQHFSATYEDPAWSTPGYVYVRIFDRGTSIGDVPAGTAYFDGPPTAFNVGWMFPDTLQEIAEGPFAGGPSSDGLGRYVLDRQVDGEPPPVPALDVVTADATVAFAVSNQWVEGTSENLTGLIRWTNNLTGDSGSLAADATWSFTATLGVGTNAITASGSNVAGQVAADAVVLIRSPAAPAPALEVLTADATVAFAVSNQWVEGTSENLTGLIRWTNSLTGESGNLAASASWSFTATLGVGTNAITASGSNAAGQVAADVVILVRLSAPQMGQTTLVLDSGKQHLIRYDYDGPPESTTLSALIGQQVPPGSQFMWMDVANQAYWPTITQDSQGSWGPRGTTTLHRGVAYWLRIPPVGGRVASNQYHVTLSGTLPAGNTTITAAENPKFSPLGYPYPTNRLWGNTALSAQCPIGSTVYFWSSSGQYFSAGSKSIKGWAAAQSNYVIRAGEGFFFKNFGASELNVVEPLP